jgi:hypothetical protein
MPDQRHEIHRRDAAELPALMKPAVSALFLKTSSQRPLRATGACRLQASATKLRGQGLQ